MRGIDGSSPAIIAALSLRSFSVATPRSGMPSLDMVVPAPVCRRHVKNMTNYWKLLPYHVKRFESSLESYAGREPIVYSGADNDVVWGWSSARSLAAGECSLGSAQLG